MKPRPSTRSASSGLDDRDRRSGRSAGRRAGARGPAAVSEQDPAVGERDLARSWAVPRKERIGEHAAEHALPWPVNARGTVPDHQLDRLDWQRRASAVGAYREPYGYHYRTEAIGPEPARGAPDRARSLGLSIRRPRPRGRARRAGTARRVVAAHARHLPAVRANAEPGADAGQPRRPCSSWASRSEP